MKSLLHFVAVAALVFVADFLWLGIVMKNFYHHELRTVIRVGPTGFAPRMLPALLVYVLIPLGIILFVGPRLTTSSSLLAAAGWGALFGLILYGVYDLTNLAILKDWSVAVTIADLVWGCVLCAASTVCLALVRRATG